MANPRQRRKARSSSHRPVSHSRRAKKNLKKQPPIRGPKVLQEAWDPHKTVRQNYAALGLMHSLNPTSSGGVEAQPVDDRGEGTSTATPVGASQNPMPSAAGPIPRSLPPGYGRIIRDADGHVVDIQLADDDDDDVQQEEESLESVDVPQQGLVGDWATLQASTRSQTGAAIVEVLAHMASDQASTLRTASWGEVAYLRRLVKAHGRDTAAMSRDIKLNTAQKTAGELMRAIRKAGGFEAMEEE